MATLLWKPVDMKLQMLEVLQFVLSQYINGF